jgi:hypothetical protein
MADYNSTFTGAQIDVGIAKANTAQQPPVEGAFVDGDKTKLDSALQSVIGTTDEVVVTGGDTISLAAAVTASLALADSALQSVIGTTDEVVVTGGDTISLAAAVTASLALADSATQPGDNVSDLTNDAAYVPSDPSGVTGADAITNMMSLTQAEYDAITPNASTFYLITDA